MFLILKMKKGLLVMVLLVFLCISGEPSPVKVTREGDVICLNYLGSFDQVVFDTNIESEAKKAGIYQPDRDYEPFCFMIGSGMIVEGLDEGVRGMGVSETRDITVPPDKGYPYGELAGKTLLFRVTIVEIKEKKIGVIVLNDRRCGECDTSGIVRKLEMIFPGIKTKELDYCTIAGKRLYQTLRLKYLPAILLDGSIRSEEGYDNIKEYVETVDSYYSLWVNASFDPTAEICAVTTSTPTTTPTTSLATATLQATTSTTLHEYVPGNNLLQKILDWVNNFIGGFL